MECLKMITVRHNGVASLVPCGKCAFCLTNKRSSWMFRVHQEMRTQPHPGWFITLTYDERYVKRVGPSGQLSLRFRDVQLFLKRLRKEKFYAKYICVGEYGGTTARPHYHMLLWTDAPVEKLDSLWKYGSCHFGRITLASAMYTLKYIIQPKVRTSPEDPREKTRAQFSKGLGLAYLNTAAYYYHNPDDENPNPFVHVDGKKVSLPRYYREKIYTKYQRRILAEDAKEKSIEKRAKLLRLAMAQGAGLEKSKATFYERYRAARIYVQALRLDQCAAILKSTKYNQTL